MQERSTVYRNSQISVGKLAPVVERAARAFRAGNFTEAAHEFGQALSADPNFEENDQ